MREDLSIEGQAWKNPRGHSVSLEDFDPEQEQRVGPGSTRRPPRSTWQLSAPPMTQNATSSPYLSPSLYRALCSCSEGFGRFRAFWMIGGFKKKAERITGSLFEPDGMRNSRQVDDCQVVATMQDPKAAKAALLRKLALKIREAAREGVACCKAVL